MGIKPDGDVNLTPPTSTPQERFQDMASDLDNIGNKAGEAWGEMYTEASSANAGAAELAADLTALEGRVDALETPAQVSGTGWRIYKVGKVVNLILDGVAEAFTIPEGFRPVSAQFAPLALGKADMNARFGVYPDGRLRLFAHTPPCYGTISYLTP